MENRKARKTVQGVTAIADRIKGLVVEIGGDTSGLSKALKEINKEITGTQSQLKDVERLLKLNPGNADLLRQKYNGLQSQIGQVQEKLKNLKEADKLAKAQLESGKLGQEKYDALRREIIETEGWLKNLERQARNTDTALSASLKLAGQKMTAAGKTILPVSTGLTGIGASAVKTGMGFDATMSQVRALTGLYGGTEGEEQMFQRLSDKAQEMGRSTRYSAKEAAEAFVYMGMAGWDAQQMIDGIDGILYAAAASGENLGRVSDIITDGLAAFHLPASRAGDMADLLAKTAATANTNISMMGETFKYVAPVMGAAGGTMEDTAQAIALMANVGVKASQAGTSLKSGLLTMMNPTKPTLAAMKQYGVTLRQTNDGALDLLGTIQGMRDSMKNLSQYELTQAMGDLVGKEAVTGWSALISASEEDFEKAVANSRLETYSGAAQKMSEVMLDNLQGQMIIIQSSLEGLALDISRVLTPHMRKAAEAVQNVCNWFAKLDSGTKESIVMVGALAAASGPALIIGGNTLNLLASGVRGFRNLGKVLGKVPGKITGVIRKVKNLSYAASALVTTIKTVVAPAISAGLTKAVAGVTAAVKGLFTLIAAHPVIAVVAAATAALVVLYRKCRPFRDFVDKLTEKVKNFFKDTLPGFLGGLAGAILNGLQLIGNSIAVFFGKTIPEFFTQTLPAVFQKAGTAVVKGLNTLSFELNWFFHYTLPDAVKDAKSKVAGWVDALIPEGAKDSLESLVSGFSTAWSGVKEILGGVKEMFSGIFFFFSPDSNKTVQTSQEVMKTFCDGTQKVMEGWNKVVSPILDAVKGFFTGMGDIAGNAYSFLLVFCKNVEL